MAAVAHAHDAAHDSPLHHQFEDIDQQNESYVVGMWTFLVQEIMFFGAMFLVYSLYRWNYQEDFYLAHHHLNVLMGAVNTTVLLFSSFAIVMAVQGAQLHRRTQVLGWLTVTQVCALVFLVIKAFEYREKFADNLFPGANFTNNPATLVPPNSGEMINLNHAQIFYGLYFGMTGLHAIHILAGIIVISALMWLWFRRAKSVTLDYIPTELVALYWHFVDLVWIFLFPLFYLMPKPH